MNIFPALDLCYVTHTLHKQNSCYYNTNLNCNDKVKYHSKDKGDKQH